MFLCLKYTVSEDYPRGLGFRINVCNSRLSCYASMLASYSSWTGKISSPEIFICKARSNVKILENGIRQKNIFFGTSTSGANQTIFFSFPLQIKPKWALIFESYFWIVLAEKSLIDKENSVDLPFNLLDLEYGSSLEKKIQR